MTRPSDVPFNAPIVERGVGFFETVLVAGRRAVLWEPHLSRLDTTLGRFSFPRPDRRALEETASRAVREASLASGEERALRLAWIAVGADLDASSSWRLDVSLRPVPEATLSRRSGCRGATLPPWLRRDTPEVKSTSYFAAIVGLRMARKGGADEGLFTAPDGSYLEGTATSLIAWNDGRAVRALSWFLPSVTAAAFLSEGDATAPLTGEALRAGSLLCGSLTLAVPLVALDGAPCEVPPAMDERIRDFNRRLLSDPALGTML
jgi:branched-subunit amino acid aminotransferase/4-amino-4-deoxychorismate lyase